MQNQDIDISDVLVEIIIFAIIGTLMSLLIYGLMWAQQEELRLGIHGRSSESLMVEHEQK